VGGIREKILRRINGVLYCTIRAAAFHIFGMLQIESFKLQRSRKLNMSL